MSKSKAIRVLKQMIREAQERGDSFRVETLRVRLAEWSA